VNGDSPNCWTLKALKEHIDALFEEKEKRYLEMFAAKTALGEVERRATEKALSLAAEASSTRFKPLEEDVNLLKDAHLGEAGRKIGMSAIIGYIIGAAGLLSLLLKVFGVY